MSTPISKVCCHSQSSLPQNSPKFQLWIPEIADCKMHGLYVAHQNINVFLIAPGTKDSLCFYFRKCDIFSVFEVHYRCEKWSSFGKSDEKSSNFFFPLSSLLHSLENLERLLSLFYSALFCNALSLFHPFVQFYLVFPSSTLFLFCFFQAFVGPNWPLAQLTIFRNTLNWIGNGARECTWIISTFST